MAIVQTNFNFKYSKENIVFDFSYYLQQSRFITQRKWKYKFKLLCSPFHSVKFS